MLRLERVEGVVSIAWQLPGRPPISCARACGASLQGLLDIGDAMGSASWIGLLSSFWAGEADDEERTLAGAGARLQAAACALFRPTRGFRQAGGQQERVCCTP